MINIIGIILTAILRSRAAVHEIERLRDSRRVSHGREYSPQCGPTGSPPVHAFGSPARTDRAAPAALNRFVRRRRVGIHKSARIAGPARRFYEGLCPRLRLSASRPRPRDASTSATRAPRC
jgi:hypothetical protein